jgi:hypothetical protein
VAGVEFRRQPKPKSYRRGPHQNHPAQRQRHRRAHLLAADRDMCAYNKHHQREAEIRQHLNRWVGDIDDAETRLADHEPRHQLADDYRNSQARQ